MQAAQTSRSMYAESESESESCVSVLNVLFLPSYPRLLRILVLLCSMRHLGVECPPSSSSVISLQPERAVQQCEVVTHSLFKLSDYLIPQIDVRLYCLA